MADASLEASRFHEALIGVVLPNDAMPIEPSSNARVERVFVAVGQRVEPGDRIGELRGASVFDVVAPFAGMVIEKCAAPGEISGPGRPLVRVSQPNRRHVRFAVPTAAAWDISPGASVTVALVPGHLRAPATILQIAKQGDADSDLAYALAAVELSPGTGSWISTGRVVYVFASRYSGKLP
jgi:hypothetical protein